jgi:hypothetical protein
MTQTVEEADRILNELVGQIPIPGRFAGLPAGTQVSAAMLRGLTPQSKLINVLQVAPEDSWIEIMSMVPAVVDQTLLDWMARNGALAEAHHDDAAVTRFARMYRLAMRMMRP